VLIAGLASLAAGLALFSQVPVDGRYVTDVLPAMLLLGAGAGVSFPSLMGLAMSSATPADSGLLSGLVNTTQQVGAALGLAVLATLATSRSDTLLAGGDGQAAALTGGYTLAFGIATGFVLAGLVIAVVALRRPQAADEMPAAALAYEEAA